MVGGFKNLSEFDVLTQRLALKEEFVGVGEITNIQGQVLVIFNTETTDPELYPYYFANGLGYLFDIVPL